MDVRNKRVSPWPAFLSVPRRLLLALILSLVASVLITAAARAEDTPQNDIPVLFVYVDENDASISAAAAADQNHSYGTFAQMQASKDHSVRCIGSVEIQVPASYTSEYGSSTVPSGTLQLSYIRGRGNSTWTVADKKPYRLEFKDAQDFFGMGASTSYALMANAMDDTLLRNRVAYWLGREIDVPFSLRQLPASTRHVLGRRYAQSAGRG